jgi:hypothetical protein
MLSPEFPRVAHIVADLDDLDALSDPTLLQRTRSALAPGRRGSWSGRLLRAVRRALGRAAATISSVLS